MVRGGSVGCDPSGEVRVPITTLEASGARLMGVWDTVMAGPPGMSV